MKLYTERGEEKWKEKLAEMGIPLKSCSRDFIAVRTEVGPRLKGKLKELIDEHSRKDIEFPSFARTFGFKKTLTASDMAYTLSALLETPREKAESHGCRINPLDEDSDLDNKSLWNFYTASDALDMSRIDEIVTGIELSKKIQEDIASTCKRLLKTRNAVSKIRNQLFFVELDTGHDWLARPNMLRKFSMFMARAYKVILTLNIAFQR
ncbi:hypothetical protein G9A89_013449 [Geosiphon pyriformis]|nr:hypothetical protein G9A89_013449 [Geosiphon pyriformis]